MKEYFPVIKKLSRETDAIISIDTYKSEVAEAALDEGASIINDITGLRMSGRKYGKACRSFNAPVIVMHMKGNPKIMQNNPAYNDVVEDICNFFSERIEFAAGCGINKEQIIIDPGIGFGKKLEHNIEIFKRLKEFKALGCPMVLGASRKRFIGKLLNQKDAKERI